MVPGDAAVWHRDVVEELVRRFDIRRVYEKVPPHITLVPPFETEHIDAVKAVVGELLRQRRGLGSFRVVGFGRFGERTVFTDVRAEEAMYRFVDDLRTRIRGVAPMTSEEPVHPWRPHVTVADQLASEEAARVWEYVQGIQVPALALPFDAAVILRRVGNAWITEKLFPFGA
ncbi:MAG: 2'-5' RNA ligase family protein [Candidatus Yanofskybacteria bacterium]|nr:2'-5' RNA ligase family protein [Candidatus Yanofskybacteria bacterium]